MRLAGLGEEGQFQESVSDCTSLVTYAQAECGAVGEGTTGISFAPAFCMADDDREVLRLIAEVQRARQQLREVLTRLQRRQAVLSEQTQFWSRRATAAIRTSQTLVSRRRVH